MTRTTPAWVGMLLLVSCSPWGGERYEFFIEFPRDRPAVVHVCVEGTVLRAYPPFVYTDMYCGPEHIDAVRLGPRSLGNDGTEFQVTDADIDAVVQDREAPVEFVIEDGAPYEVTLDAPFAKRTLTPTPGPVHAGGIARVHWDRDGDALEGVVVLADSVGSPGSRGPWPGAVTVDGRDLLIAIPQEPPVDACPALPCTVRMTAEFRPRVLACAVSNCDIIGGKASAPFDLSLE